MRHAYTCTNDFWRRSTTLALGLFVLYKLFPRLRAGLRGCTYYWERLATVTVSLVPTLSSRRWCLPAFYRNKCRPQIVAIMSSEINSSSGIWNTVFVTLRHACHICLFYSVRSPVLYSFVVSLLVNLSYPYHTMSTWFAYLVTGCCDASLCSTKQVL